MKRLLSRITSVDIILWPTIIALVALLLGFDAVSIRGPSMEPSLRDGQTVFVNRLAYGLRGPGEMGYIVSWGTPGPGHLVVFRHPNGGHLAVKRCLLGPGATVRLTRDRLHIADGRSFRITSDLRGQLDGRTEIPGGFVFVLGENLSASSDSRDFGLLPVSGVHGRVIIPTGSSYRRNEG
ncbi:MAG: signal peptidase I [Spirochaetaceae bacterium]